MTTEPQQELPPGCTFQCRGRLCFFVTSGGAAVTEQQAWEFADEALRTLGITREEYQRLLACKRFVDDVGDVVITSRVDGWRIGEHEDTRHDGSQRWMYGPKETFQEIVNDWCDESCDENKVEAVLGEALGEPTQGGE